MGETNYVVLRDPYQEPFFGKFGMLGMKNFSKVKIRFGVEVNWTDKTKSGSLGENENEEWFLYWVQSIEEAVQLGK